MEQLDQRAADPFSRYHDPKIDKVLIPIPETCTALGVGRNSVYNLINAGKLEVVKIGRRTLVKMASIKALAA